MEQYIPKSALVAEIKNLIERAEAERVLHPKTILSAKNYLLIEDYKKLLSFLDNLEVKEVDLEKEYEEFVVDDHILGNFITNDTMGMKVAKHFFELGISVSNKAQERKDVDAQINSQNDAIKQLNSALNSMEHNGHLPKMMAAAESLGISEEEYAKIEYELFEEQEEPVSEDLEEAAKNHAVERYRATRDMVLAEKCKWSFKAGANWEREQIAKENMLLPFKDYVNLMESINKRKKEGYEAGYKQGLVNSKSE